MRKNELKLWYENNHIAANKCDEAIVFLTEIEDFLTDKNHFNLDDVNQEVLDEMIKHIVDTKQNTVAHFITLMRYYKMINHHDNFIRLTQYTGGYGVIDSILKKMSKVMGESFKEAVLKEIDIPVLGTPPTEMIHFTKRFITWLESHLNAENLRLVLSDNHHQIPRESFIEEKVLYE